MNTNWLLGLALVVIFGAVIYFVMKRRTVNTGGTAGLDITAAEKKSGAKDTMTVEKGKGKEKV